MSDFNITAFVKNDLVDIKTAVVYNLEFNNLDPLNGVRNSRSRLSDLNISKVNFVNISHDSESVVPEDV